MTLTSGAILIVVLTALASWLPVPYVVLSPGPTANTLGTDGSNGEVISISGHATYPTSGHLQLLTVSLRGGPGRRMDLVTALRAWFDPHDAVVPTKVEFPDNPTPQQVEKRNAEDMELSQSAATTAALTQLGIPIERDIVVKSIQEGAPALGTLKAGDVVRSVDGKPASTPESVSSAIQAHTPGDPVSMTVERGGKTLTLQVPTAANEQGKARIGVEQAVRQTYPFQVKIGLQDVGGPSAGMMFALGIIDKLTPGELTGGQFVAGTGTIDDSGKVGPIGGIQQKLAGARAAGARWFLAPADNCGETHGVVPKGLRVVKVSTLKEAYADVTAIGQGKAAALPTC
ncbi:YlbL family protein [Motilibacter peucedani]|uniref:YlbL family protein n=1 Tax=Motilibacter peucedani TaxID=598650 RepID=UPI001E3D8026|nr:PDZ domain-containing protein [Motilibacter peucedani]